MLGAHKKSAELIKPWLDGHEILKWTSQWSHQYLIKIESSANVNWPWSKANTENEARVIFQQQFPAIYSHIIAYENKLKAREDQGLFWWELRSCAYYDAFLKTKILYNETSKELHAFIDQDGFHVNKTGFIIISEDNEYLLGLLNSKLLDWYYRVDFPTYGDPWKGGRIQFRKSPNMLGVPIANADIRCKSDISTLVQNILALTISDDYLQNSCKQKQVSDYEKQIDQMVYQLYGLTPEEIAIVEEKVK